MKPNHMKSHDFVGPFEGADALCAINLCLIEAITAHSDGMLIRFCGTSNETVYRITFSTIEHYVQALHALRSRGVSLPLPKVTP